MARLCTILALLAVLLLPLGMQPATASPAEHHAAMMPTQHCPEQAPKHHLGGGIAECTMACSVALPAADLPQAQPRPVACQLTKTDAAHALHGLHPDTATPPPKIS